MPVTHENIILSSDSQYLGRIDPVIRRPFKHGDNVYVCPKKNEAVLASSLASSENRCPFCGELLIDGPLPYTSPHPASQQKKGMEKQSPPPTPYEGNRRNNWGAVAAGFGVTGVFAVILLCVVGAFILSIINNSTSATSNSNPAPISYPTQVPEPTSAPVQVSSPTQEPAPTSVPNTPVQLPAPQQSTSNAKISCADKLYFVNLRRTPGYNGKDKTDSLYEVPCGETVQILGPTKKVDGLTWWNVSWNGYTGWIADHTASGKTVLIFNP